MGGAKDWHGLGRFRLGRLEKVNIEALLIASRQNIKRLIAARERVRGSWHRRRSCVHRIR
jgi:hypothetical protein